MKRCFLRKDGFTLIELLIVISIMLVVMGLGYSLYFYAQKSFSNYEERWLVQNEAREISRFLEDRLDTVYQCEILENSPTSFDNQYSYLWNQDNRIHIQYTDDSGDVVTTSLNHESDLTVEFIHGTDSRGNPIDNFLQFQVSGVTIDYEVLNGVELRNLGRNMTIDGLETGSGLKFKTVSLISDLPEFDYSTFCIVATASYGSYQEPAVMLLRRFRDEFLNKFPAGRAFVRFYYSNSQPLAQIISKSDLLRQLTRIILYPFIAIAAMILNPAFRTGGLIYLICWLLLYFGFKQTMMRYINKNTSFYIHR